jgi:hypothetical protein
VLWAVARGSVLSVGFLVVMLALEADRLAVGAPCHSRIDAGRHRIYLLALR